MASANSTASASSTATASASSIASRIIVGKKYKLLKKIGEGSYGKIFKATGLETDNVVAIKISTDQALIRHEAEIYNVLKDIKYVPSLFATATEGKFSYLVMDLLEQNLEQLHIDENSIAHWGKQMLTILESIHARGIIHSDIKPANFLLKTNRELYLIDFGLASRYIQPDGTHRPCATNVPLLGTVRFMSVNIHHHLTASRRDDIEAVGYTLLYLQEGQLPWQNKRDLVEIVHLKEQLLPLKSDELWLFIRYCRKLAFNAQPNYTYLRKLLELQMI